MLSACEYNNVYMNCAIWLCSQYCMLYCDTVSVGSGHTMSLQWSEQCSWTLSKRYHWCFRGSPGGKVWCGSSVAIRSRDVPCVNQCTVPSYSFFTDTCPGKRWDKWKCCIFLIPLNSVLVVCLLKWSPQLNVGMIVSPLWDPTNCAIFGVAELLTNQTVSSRQSVLVHLYCCFNSPKYQLGKNLVCPIIGV